MAENEEKLTRKQQRELRKEQKAEEQSQLQRQAGGKRALAWAFGILALVAVVIFMFQSGDDDPAEEFDVPSDHTEVTADDNVKGDPETEVVVYVYSDLQCPACAAYVPMVEMLAAEFGDSIAVVYRHFPLHSIHPTAEEAAWAAEAAALQDKFWEMHDLLFASQAEWSSERNVEDIFSRYADEIGLDVDRFADDYGSETVKNRVDRDEAIARSLRLNSTPTFYINDTKISPNPRSYSDLKRLVEAEL